MRQNTPQFIQGVMVQKSTGKIVERRTINTKTGEHQITFQHPDFARTPEGRKNIQDAMRINAAKK